MNEDKEMGCIVCGISAQLMCQRCGESYCSDVCQHIDWKRHKYICSVMPALVAKKGKLLLARHETVPTIKKVTKPIEAPIENKVLTCSIESKVESLSLVELSQKWRETAMPPENEFFECRVSHMESDGPIWVLEVANTENLQRLTDNISISMQNQKPCNFNNLSVGDLVGIDIDGKIFRGEVLALNASGSKCAKVRLIDYGSEISCNANDIYLPVQCMSEYKAFALRVKLPTNTGVQVNKELTLRMLGNKSPDGIEQVQLKPKMTVPLNLPVEKLAVSPEVSVAQILQHDVALKEPQVALLQVKLASSLNDDLNARLNDKPVSSYPGPFPKEMHTFFLAARTKQGFRRAFLLDFIEDPPAFLVYEMDEGRISVSSEVRRIPSDLLGHTLGVFAVTLEDGGSLKQLLTQCGPDLCIKFQMESLHGTDQEKMRAAQATLFANNKPICAVRASTFKGQVTELGHKYWREPIESGSKVFITHVANYSEVCISSVQTKEYDIIFKNLNSKCPTFNNSSDISIGSIVLVVPPNQNNYRAEITGAKNNKFTVYNIDTGSTQTVQAEWLRRSCRFLENLPVSQCRAKISTVCNFPPGTVPQNTVAVQLLMKLFNQKTEMQVEFMDPNRSTIDLLDFSIEPQSLMTRMLPLIFTPAAVELKPAQNPLSVDVVAPEPNKGVHKQDHVSNKDLPPLPLSPPITPIPQEVATKRIKRYYVDDVERHLIPLGDKMQLIILNAVGLHKTGYVTGCYFSNEKNAADFQQCLDNVAKIGANDDQLQSGYLPDVNEMCLCLFSEDQSWYRGVCQKVSGQKASILYCDFGNSEIVSLDKIKPIPKEALYGIQATKCFVEGFDEAKNFLVLEQYLAVKNKANCSVFDGPEPNSRRIQIPNLDKILSKELI